MTRIPTSAPPPPITWSPSPFQLWLRDVRRLLKRIL